MATKVIMPQLGESVVEGTVTKWLRQEGETIGEFEPLLEVNTDKVDSEIPSTASGTVLKILVEEGTTVNAGTVLAWIGKPGEAVPGGASPSGGSARQADQAQDEGEAPDDTQRVEVEDGQASEEQPAPVGRHEDLGFISPVVARMARENNVDLTRIRGTGNGGRITKKDVLDFLGDRPREEPVREKEKEAAAWETPGEGDLFRPTELQAAPEKATSSPLTPALSLGEREKKAPAQDSPGEEKGRVIPLNPMRKAIAEHMLTSKRTSPHVTTLMEADMSRVAAHREANKTAFARDGVDLTYTAYFAAAAAAALRSHPLANSSWSETGIRVHPDIGLGIAVSLGEEGLIVPVIRRADGLSLLGLAREINELGEKARGHRLEPDAVKGGTFTITNHGVSGSLLATPIINQPQCAILGVGAIQKRVVVLDGDAIAVRPMVYLTLTFDHRILDGASADGFLGEVVRVLEEWT